MFLGRFFIGPKKYFKLLDNMNTIKRFFLLLVLLLVANCSFANDNEKADEGFDTGAYIMGHIGDSYEWHICTIGETHVSIPLPILAYSEHSGFHAFMSSNLHHGHQTYQNFGLSHSSGKLVEYIDGQEVRPWDFSITKNVAALFISIILIMWIFTSMAKHYSKNAGRAPKGVYNLIEPIIVFVKDDIIEASIGKEKAPKYTPYLLTVFFFIFINNLMGLIPFFPGGANLTGNIAVTLVLALLTFIITSFSGNKHYWKDIFWPDGVPIWLKIPPIIPIVEIMGVFIKPFVLMVRLFANITAGHIVALSFFGLIFIFAQQFGAGVGYGTSVVSIIFTVFMSVLELLVAFIQAYVFTFLSSLYIGSAVHDPHAAHGNEH